MVKNQNYMTNKKIKAEVDKNQKGYQTPDNQTQEQNSPQKEKYYFKSYSDENKTNIWGVGSVETTGNVSNHFVEVKVLTNTDDSFVDALFFITEDAKTDGTIYQLYSDAGTTGTGIYVEIATSPIE